MEGEILPFEMGYLPEFFQKKAEVELGESPEIIRKGLREMKHYIQNDKTFDGMSFDDGYLLQFLRCKKHNSNRAASHIKTAAIFRTNNLSSFRAYDFEKISIGIKNKVINFLPFRCAEGCAILRFQIDNWKPDEFPVEHFRRAVVVVVLQALRDPMTQVNGIKLILDTKSPSLKHIRHITPHNLYLFYYGTQVCAPVRFRSIHIVNHSVFLKYAWAVLQNFMSAKVKERTHFHSRPETLLNFFPAEVLPAEYGGKLEDYDMSDWLTRMMTPEKMATLGGGRFPGM